MRVLDDDDGGEVGRVNGEGEVEEGGGGGY